MAIALSNPTAGKLISSVRNLLNQPNSNNSFWTDAELLDYINEGIRMYFAEVTNNDEGYFTKVANLNIVANQEAVALPSDCYEVKAVYKSVNDGFVVLAYRNMISESYTTQGGTGTESFFPSYYFRENGLILRPVPNFSQTAAIQIEYIYFPDTMVSATDVMNTGVSPIFKQLIEMYAVYKAKMKESLVQGTNTAAMAQENLNQIYTLFKDTIVNRSKYPQFVKAFLPESNW